MMDDKIKCFSCGHELQPTDTVRIPLRGIGGVIRGYVLIDAADAELVNQWRWHLRPDGYAARDNEVVDGKRIARLLHRELLGLQNGNPLEVDHIDRNRLNDRRSNLRIANHADQMQNHSRQRNGSSKYRGVSWDKSHGKWFASVHTGGKSYFMGRFDNEEEAAAAALEGRRRLMPFAHD